MLQDLLPAKTAWEGGGDPRWKDIILLESAQITQGEKGCFDCCWLFLPSFLLFSFFFLFFPFPPLFCYPPRAKDESLLLRSKLEMWGCFLHK